MINPPRVSVLLYVALVGCGLLPTPVAGQPFMTLDALPRQQQQQQDNEAIGAFGNPTDAAAEVSLSDEEKATFDVLSGADAANDVSSNVASSSPDPKQEPSSSSRSRSTTGPAPSTESPTLSPSADLTHSPTFTKKSPVAPARSPTDEPTLAPTHKRSTSPTQPQVEREVEIFLVDAAYISENYPDRNYNAEDSGFVLISTLPRLDALLRFELPAASFDSSRITGATLEVDTIYGVDPVGAWIYSDSNDWSTSSANWNSTKSSLDESALIGSMEVVEGRSKAILDTIVTIDGRYINLRIVAGRDDDYSALGLDAKITITYLSPPKEQAPHATVTDEDLLKVIEMELDEIDDDSESSDVKDCNTKKEKHCRNECFEENRCDPDDPLSKCHSRCRDDCCSSDDGGAMLHDAETEEDDLGAHNTEDEGDDDSSRTDYTFPIQDDSLPCEEYNRRNPEGVYYVKIPKTDTYYWSSIAYRTALKQDKNCFVQAEHADAYELNLRNRNTRKSFAFTFIRDPKEYILKTYFYFKVTKNGEKPTAKSIVEYSREYGNKQSEFMMCEANKRSYENKGIQGANNLAKAIVSEYDFVGLVEKPDESLVLLGLLLGLDTKDVLYNPSPNAGTISMWKDDKGFCERVKEAFIPRGAKRYFDSDDFSDDNDIDIELYKEVERTMEATIDKIGRGTYTEALRKYREQMEVVERICLPTVEYKCNTPGKRWKDLNNCGKDGCDAACLSSLNI